MKANLIDMFQLRVDHIDKWLTRVDKQSFYRHISQTCPLDRHVLLICRFLRILSTGWEYMSISCADE